MAGGAGGAAAGRAFRKNKPVCAAILATSRTWIADAAELLSRLGVEPVVIGGAARDGYRHASFVYMDYREATYQLVEYLRYYGKKRIALFAVSPDSATDMIKKDAFLACENCPERDVFYFTDEDGLMNVVCKRFLEVCRNYDAVICANDVSAIILLQHLEDAGIHVPEDLFLCAFGDMEIGSSGRKTLTIARLNCLEIGRQVVSVCHLLTAAEDISGINTKIRCEFAIGDTTASLPYVAETLGTAHAPAGQPEQAKPDPVADLKAKLQEAISRENYEEAARLRDEIRRLEGQK